MEGFVEIKKGDELSWTRPRVSAVAGLTGTRRRVHYLQNFLMGHQVAAINAFAGHRFLQFEFLSNHC